ncbi:MAG: hypothetical protein ACRCTK_04250, partial [Alphaproteobacteria bacterium]
MKTLKTMRLYEQLQVWATSFFPDLSKEDALREVKAVVLETLQWSALDLLERLKSPITLEEGLQVEALLQRRA